MSEKLKPVSSAARDLLSLLGVTPEEFQSTPTKGKPKFQEPTLTPTSQVVSNWVAPEDTWRPDARVLFLRHTTCLSCGASFTSPHWPETFIRQRRKGEAKGLKSHKYTPSRSHLLSSIKLPHVVEHLNVEVYACHFCPDWQVNQSAEEQQQCLEELALSHLGSSKSKLSLSDQTLSTWSGSVSGLLSQNPVLLGFDQASPVCTAPATWNFTGLSQSDGGKHTYDLIPGFNSSAFALAQYAAAQHIPSPITLAGETAEVSIALTLSKI